MKKVYLDMDILSAFAKRDMPEATLNALIQLLQFAKAHKIGLFTSDVHRTEIERYGGSLLTDRTRWNLEVVYLLAENVQFIEAQRLLGINVYWDRFGTCTNSPMIENHPTWTKCRALSLSEIDAHHLMVAIEAKCDVFLTCDKRTILNRRTEIEREFSTIKLMEPQELVAALS